MKKYIVVILILFSSFTVLNAQGLDIPDPPVFESASVIPGSSPARVELSWQPSDSADVEGYIIYEVTGGITQQFDTVWGRLTTIYSHFNSGADTESKTYRMAAFDTLDNLSRLTDPHTTIFSTLDYEICDLEITLSWSAYSGWASISKYNIYRSLAGGTYQKIGSVSGNSTSFTDESAGEFSNYDYYVEAERNDGTAAASNVIHIYTDSYEAPAFLNADYASVENEQIELSFTIDSSGQTENYRILRSDDSVYYTTIKTIQNTGQTIINHTDTKVAPADQKYYYKIQALDPCGNIMKESNLASNIILKVTSDDMLTHYLNWSEYQDWQGGVKDYEIYAHFGDDAPFLISTKDADVFTGSNNISSYVKHKHGRDEFVQDFYCYYILAKENSIENPIGVQGVAKSNEVCVYHQPRFFAPNAFYPNSYNEENRLFKPVVSFINKTGYKFKVFDRWGMEIFSTTDPTESWDGTIDERRAKPGKYVFYVSYSDATGHSYEQSGVFILYNK